MADNILGGSLFKKLMHIREGEFITSYHPGKTVDETEPTRDCNLTLSPSQNAIVL